MIKRKIVEGLYYFKIVELGIEGVARDPKNFWKNLHTGTRLLFRKNSYGNKGGMRLISYKLPNGEQFTVENRGILIHGIPSGIFRPEFSQGCIVPIKKVIRKEPLYCTCYNREEVPTCSKMEVTIVTL